MDPSKVRFARDITEGVARVCEFLKTLGLGKLESGSLDLLVEQYFHGFRKGYWSAASMAQPFNSSHPKNGLYLDHSLKENGGTRRRLAFAMSETDVSHLLEVHNKPIALV